ncbi:MAG: Binding-protein-dependent transport system inner membrane component [Candidatus Uhrbacteria bacterium GW2011_GWF2_39_13]|uniref:Binding-protein-dependent transport system inner membrane component n=1 Tax=Candidatus Uhrbacteria bacterium GW2011_GWF2_39_13 TaxID=1618995 RepID=A0A0G0QRW6_9BACT|nr:MAG: Binding-protein-dependent transport system inner membrane component [Candidatus Uhrbacteria bacterium GW2011_GWF2_39_13]
MIMGFPEQKHIGRNTTAWLYLAPNFLGFLSFTFIPVLFAIVLSFFRWDIFNPPQFVGFENLRDLLGMSIVNGKIAFNDPYFWKYLWNTVFLMLTIPVNMLVSLLIAIMLNHPLKCIGFFRSIFYLPTICGGVGILLLWSFIYNPEFGLLNQALALIGIKGPGWLTDCTWAKPAIMLMGTWGAMGGTNMLLYLAGLQGISEELYEAANIDGASVFQKFRHITLPMLRPTSFFIFIMSVIAGFQGGFDAAFILTGGGPAGATTTLSYYIFNHAFVWFNMGYAATIALVLFLIVLIITIINWRFGGNVHE